MSAVVEVDGRPDRLVSLNIPAAVADRLDTMAGRHGLTVQELVRHMAGNLASLIDHLPAAAKRAARAQRRGEDE